MIASTSLRVGLVSMFSVMTWVKPASASSDCASTLRIEAPNAIRSSFRSRLAQGRLANVPEANCRGSVVKLNPLGTGWKLAFTSGSAAVSREVISTELAAVWVESWLLPATSIDVSNSVADNPTNQGDGSLPPLETQTVAAQGFTVKAVEASAAISSAIGSLWFGPELHYRQAIGNGFWFLPRLGLAYAVSNRPDGSARMLRVSSALGVNAYRSPSWQVIAALDLGMTSLLWTEREKGIHVTGPGLGAQVAVGRALTDSLWLVGRVEASALFADRVETKRERVYFSTHSDESAPVSIVTSDERLGANFVGSLSIGLCFQWGVNR